MTSWIGDFFRFWWGLIYWNTRKSLFVLKGRDPGSCPCQNFSDSGLAMQTRCDASAAWNRGARFKLVCPLLADSKDGLRCSVNTAGVRPFWGRACLFLGGAFLVVYLFAAVLIFFALKNIGYEVGLTSVIWPPQWSEVGLAQERLYASRAQEAMAAGNFPGAILALEKVIELNPRNRDAALALANLLQISGRGAQANIIYERLMKDFPTESARVAQVWYRSLLNYVDFQKIKELAPRMLIDDPQQIAPWLHALFFATRQTTDPGPLRVALASSHSLPDWTTFVLTLEHDLQTGETKNLSQLTRVQIDVNSPYVALYQVDRLIMLGRHQDALTVLNGYGNRIPADEAAFQRLRIFSILGWTALAQSEADHLLTLPMRPQLAAQFCAHLIRHPDRGILARYVDRFVRDGPRVDAESYPVFASTYLAAARCGDAARADYVAEYIRRLTEDDPRALTTLREMLVGTSKSRRIDLVLPAIPLPTDVVYALLEHFLQGSK